MRSRIVSKFIFVAYCALLIDVLVFKYIPTIRIGHLMFNLGGGAVGPANFIPFKTISRYLFDPNGGGIALLELMGNIIALIPIGFLVSFVYRNMTWQKALALAFTAGLAIEGMQVLFEVGIFDVDDVLLNASGVMIGYLFFVLLLKRDRDGQSDVRY